MSSTAYTAGWACNRVILTIGFGGGGGGGGSSAMADGGQIAVDTAPEKKTVSRS